MKNKKRERKREGRTKREKKTSQRFWRTGGGVLSEGSF